MKRIIQRLAVVAGLSGGLIAAAQTAAEAKLSANHCEPVAPDDR